jgi:hypothetical protein
MKKRSKYQRVQEGERKEEPRGVVEPIVYRSIVPTPSNSA